ncbi:MAG: hypothetical protein R3A48_13385 [Polyangiales bacterium]
MTHRIQRLSFSLGLLAALASAGCHDRDEAFDTSLNALTPVTTGASMFFVVPASARAMVANLAQEGAPLRSVPVGLDPVILQARVDGATPRGEALILSRGARGDLGVSPEPGSLTALTAAGVTRRYALGSPFNALAQTDDGRFAMTYFRPQSASGRLLFNPNEVALVDLDAPPSATNPTLRTVRSFGGVPNDVAFSPPIEIGGVPRRFAVVLSDAYVTLLDLDHPARSEVTVRLTLPEDPRAIRPEQVLFDAAEATIYLRAAASNDVYVLKLNAVSATDALQNDYRPTINQLAAGRSPADIALIGDAGARRLLVVSPGSRDARVIDARANTITTVPLDAAANRILLFNAAAPGDATPRDRALLYATGGGVSAVSFLELTDIDARRAQNVETLNLGRGILSALPLLDRGVVMLGHQTSGGLGQLSLLDLARRTAAPIFAEVSLSGAQFDSDRRSLWIAPRGSDRVGFIDLQTFRPGELRLDESTELVVPLRGDAAGRNRVVAVHQGAGGWISVIDANDPRRETVRSLRGYLLSDLLDREGSP